MAKMSREDLVKEIVQTVYDCAPELEGVPLTEETVINTDTNIDSMGMTLIICRLEANLNVKVPHKEWDSLQTLGDVANVFYARM